MLPAAARILAPCPRRRSVPPLPAENALEPKGSGAFCPLLAGSVVSAARPRRRRGYERRAWKLVRAGEIRGEHGARFAVAVPAAFSALVGAARLSARAFTLAHELDHPVY